MQQAFKVIIFVLLIVLVKTAIDTKCIKCICQKESGCKPLPCKWDDDSVSCGYFQIKKPYYIDCGTPGRKANEDIEKAWQRCALNYNCSVQCINAYIKRYINGCKKPNASTCEKVSRIHNAGPNGCSAPRTDSYWRDVSKCLSGKH